ncbi:MAG TPA: protein-disulfide reductase DsbD domain-containing protein [Chthoniobacterales bacterium]|nr:protein-disulfide reductase DsbD domain-containing protein [Chthoniobacterales bacterium]
MVVVSVFMSRLPRFALLALIALAVLCRADAQVYQGRELVKAELLADTTAVVPGKPFTAGVLLRMVPGWHTYWKFAGDAGLPTEIKWNLPPGWKAGEIQWPIPRKLVEPGDIQVYGYKGEVLLMQEITPPADVAAGPVKLNADVNWLVCEKICIPGSASLQLELPVAQTSGRANEEAFANFRRALPQPWPGGDVAQASWSRTPNEFLLQVKSSVLANYPSVEFHPSPGENVVIGHPAVERSGDGVAVRIPIETAEPNVQSVPGLVVFGSGPDAADRNAWQVGGASVAVTAAAPQPTGARGIATFLLLGFLGGFILNLMPCVLPVISLKIFGFIQHAGHDRRRIFRSGVAFVAGIFVWFLGLALFLIILKSAGSQVGWAVQFTNPYFVLAMSVIVLVFALNLFGVFEITLPQSANRGVLAWTSAEGNLGSFLQGVFATILGTSCTAPVLGAAVGFALAQSSAVILLMFLCIAAGMGAPYLLLAAQPAWVKLLPKPGAWMERVKQLMGFPMLATLVFLLYVLGAQRGLDALVWTLCFLLAVSIACWMKGAFLVPTASARNRAIVLVLMLALVLGSGAYFIGGKFAHTKLEAATAKTDGDWLPFTPERLETELAAGRAVFIDFTAAWCITCKFNETTVLESAPVRDAFERRGIVKFKADWTNADPAITKLLQQFGRPGVPLYVLYPAGKSVEPIILPELLTKNIVLEQLETIAPQMASQ